MNQTLARLRRLGGPALLTGLLALLLALAGAPRATAADTNVVQSITSVKTDSGPGVEITLSSSRPFEIRNDILFLQIGTSAFHLSHAPADGSLNTVTFVLTAAEFAATKTGDPLTVYYDTSTPTGTDAWNFGALDKSQLPTPAAPAHPQGPAPAPSAG